MRILLQILLPLLAPIILYVGWLVLRGKGVKLPDWSEGPWFWLVVIGIVLVAISLMTFGLSNLQEPDGQYVAPRYDGEQVLPPQHR